MRRRAFTRIVSLGVLALPRYVRAQGVVKVPRVGYLGRSLAGQQAFLEGLRAQGYVVGDTVLVESRLAQHSTNEEYSALTSQLIAARVDVLLASNPQVLEAMVSATRTIPIVGVDLESDPVARGWVAGLARPGGNVTGFFLDLPQMSGKQLQLLKDVKPTLARVAVLGDRAVNDVQFRAIEDAARSGGVTLQTLPIKSQGEIPGAVAAAARQQAGALLVLTSPLLFEHLRIIAEAAVRHRLPTINLFVPFFAEAGGLLAYGPGFLDLFRDAAGYVARILRGARPGDLPVQRPTKFELIINLRTAKALSLQIPQAVLLQANRVIT